MNVWIAAVALLMLCGRAEAAGAFAGWAAVVVAPGEVNGVRSVCVKSAN